MEYNNKPCKLRTGRRSVHKAIVVATNEGGEQGRCKEPIYRINTLNGHYSLPVKETYVVQGFNKADIPTFKNLYGDK